MLQGHQQQVPASGPRHLILGPIVPEGEEWLLLLLVLAAKNNMDPNHYPMYRTTAEVSVCVNIPHQSTHEELPPMFLDFLL